MFYATSNYEKNSEAFKQFVLPLFPIIYPSDIDLLLNKFKNALILPIELTCLCLVVEIGNLVAQTKINWNWGFSTPHICSSSLNTAAKYIHEAKDPNLHLIQACLLMGLFLQQNAQSCDLYLNKAVNCLRMIDNEVQSEEIALLWLSLACIKLETPNLKTLQLLVPVIRAMEFPSDQRLLQVFGTPFANQQRRRILWVENHLNDFYSDSFHTEVDSMRLQTYIKAEMTRMGTYICRTDEVPEAFIKFILAAQRLDPVDRVRNIFHEAKCLLILKEKMEHSEWLEIAPRTMAALSIFRVPYLPTTWSGCIIRLTSMNEK